MNDVKYDRFYPGKTWFDTDGKRIQAHGGSIIYVDNKFYLYGENKEKTLPSSNIWHWGVRLYSSNDLYNWKNEGIILKPSMDKDSPVYYNQCMDRPHIVYNSKTKKFVMWLKIMKRENKKDQFMTIAVADKITDEFKIISTKTILNISSGDFDLFVDDETKKAYIYFDEVHEYNKDYNEDTKCHKHIISAVLTDDYTDVDGKFTKNIETIGGRFGREAPAFFMRNKIMYLLTSATTGYIPNPTEYAVAKDYLGPFERKGAIHKNDTENLSFRSQVSSVFRHPLKKDLYIALADRWLVNLPKHIGNNLYESMLGKSSIDEKTLMSKTELEKVYSCNKPETRNTSIADYVWLPIEFDGDKPKICWYDEWKIEDFK